MQQVCNAVAINGHLNCLIYLCENGCPCDDSTMSLAIKYGQSECVRYLYENGHQIDNDAYHELYQRMKKLFGDNFLRTYNNGHNLSNLDKISNFKYFECILYLKNNNTTCDCNECKDCIECA
jgi:hypothetical protein